MSRDPFWITWQLNFWRPSAAEIPMRRTLPNGSSPFGASMGRGNVLPESTVAPIVLFVQRLQWVDADYDEGGSYWGNTGKDYVWWAHGANGDDNDVQLFVRGAGLKAARTAVLAKIPCATFGEAGGLDLMLSAYIERAMSLCFCRDPDDDSEDPDESEPIASFYTRDDIDDASVAAMRTECEEFLAAHSADIGDEFEMAGEDLWMTRCSHGAGFWDGRWPEPAATRLTESAHALGQLELYVGDDKKIYLQGSEPSLAAADEADSEG